MRKLCMCNKRHEELCWLVACKLLGTALPSRRDALRAATRQQRCTSSVEP